MFARLFCLIIIWPLIFECFGQPRPPDQVEGLEGDFVTTPLLKWKFRTSGPVFSTPVISNGVVFAGSLDSTLYAVQLSTGKLLWKLKTGGEIRSTVCLYKNSILVYSGDATLYSINMQTGDVLWSFKTKGGILGDRRYDFADYFQSSAVIDNGQVFFGAGDGRVYSLDAETGTLIWTFKANGIIHTTAALYKDRLFVGSFDGYLYALKKETGQLVWKFKTLGHHYFPDGEVQGAPVVANEIVYFGARDYNLYAIDAMNGYAHWNKVFPFGWAMAISPRDTVVYAGTSDDRVLVCLDGQSGKELWRTPTKFNIFGPCAFTKTMAYVGTLMGKLFGIDLREGKIKWTFTTDGYNTNHLRYFKADDNFRDDIMSILKTPVDFIGMEYKLGAIFSTPAISKDHLVVSTTEGYIYCLKR
jgi:eukaryotic-like serine/threonine-protein kinase